MKRIAWITDSTAYVTDQLLQHPDVYVVPMVIIFGDNTYEDGVDIVGEQLYDKMKEYGTVPTTSQPAIGTFVELYEKLKEEYETVIILHASQKLSGTYYCSVQAADMVGISYHAIDSEGMSTGLTYLLEEGIYLEEKGYEVSEIVDKITNLVQKLENYILIGSLQQLHRSGRLSNAQFVMGTLLNIKPIIRIHNGIVEAYEKVRSEKKAVKLIMEKCKAALEKYEITKMSIIHGNREEDAQIWKQELLSYQPNLQITIAPLNSALSVHAGKGTLAAMWYNARLEG